MKKLITFHSPTMSPTKAATPRFRKITIVLAVIIAIGFLLRLAYSLFFRPLPNSDPAVYVNAAQLLLRTPTDFSHSWYMLWPNGYSGLLGFFGSLLGAQTVPYVVIAGLNLLFGTLEILLIFRVVALLTHRRAWGLAAAAVTAINPLFILYSSVAFTESICSALSTLLIFLFLSILSSGGRCLYSLVSFSIIATIAFNYNARLIGFLLIPPTLLFMCIDWRKAVKAAMVLVIFYIIVAAPKIAIIHQDEGKWPLGSLVGGVNLYIGNSSYANGRYYVKDNDPIWRKFVETRGVRPYRSNLALLKAARRNIARNPLHFLQLIPLRIRALLADDHPPLDKPAFVHTEWIDSFLPTVASDATSRHFRTGIGIYLKIFKSLFVTFGVIAAAMMMVAAGKMLLVNGWAGAKRIRKVAGLLIVPIIMLLNLATIMAMFGDTRFFYIFYSHLAILILTAPVFCRELLTRGESRFRLPNIRLSPIELNSLMALILAGWIWFVMRMIHFP